MGIEPTGFLVELEQVRVVTSMGEI